jgi:hypothetical protein
LGKKQIKVGVRQSGGPDPGYLWNVGIIDFGFAEVSRLVNKHEYEHLAMQVKELARESDPSHPLTVSVDAVEDFFELREKGGILGKKNMRIFFGIDKTARAIIILGGICKQNNGPTPDGTRVAMRRRWRKYKNGDYGTFSP